MLAGFMTEEHGMNGRLVVMLTTGLSFSQPGVSIGAASLDAIAPLGLGARVTHDLSRARLGCCQVQVMKEGHSREMSDVSQRLSRHCGDHNLFIHIYGHVLLMLVRIF